MAVASAGGKECPKIVDILIEHGTLLTLNEHRHIVTDGAIAIRADRIAAVGKTADLRNEIQGQEDHRCIEAVGHAGPRRWPRTSG